MESVVKNYVDKWQTIMIRDPNSGKTASIPTHPCGHLQKGEQKWCDHAVIERQDF